MSATMRMRRVFTWLQHGCNGALERPYLTQCINLMVSESRLPHKIINVLSYYCLLK